LLCTQGSRTKHDQQSINSYHHNMHVHGHKSNSNRALTDFTSISQMARQ
jgi:hypothetical protein